MALRRVATALVLVALALTTLAQYRPCTNGDPCININQCSLFTPYLRQPVSSWPDNVKREVKNRVCRSEVVNGKNVHSVCCPSGGKSGLALIDVNNCGIYSDNKIAFGKVAKLYDFPWMVLLKYRSGQFNCGGTLINDRYVLTAAHCFLFDDVVSVRIGEYDLDSPIDCDKRDPTDCALPPQDIDIEKVIKHPMYSNRKKKNDIALIRLSRKAEFNDNVSPICLPITPNLRPTMKNFFVAGWGTTETGEPSALLRFAKLPLVGQADCQAKISQQDRYLRIDESQICAGGVDRVDNCLGDSGGPLKALTASSRYVQYGIVSYGLHSCGVDSSPGVYTKVEHYVDWILQNIYE